VTTDVYYIDTLGRLRTASWLGLWGGLKNSAFSSLLRLKVALRDHSQFLNFLMQRYRLFNVMHRQRHSYLDDPARVDTLRSKAVYRMAYRKIDHVLGGLRGLASEVGSQFAVIRIPSRENIRKNRLDDGGEFIKNWCQQNVTPLIDLGEEFAQARSEDLYFRIDSHWNSRGHAHAARAIYKRLQGIILNGKFAH